MVRLTLVVFSYESMDSYVFALDLPSEGPAAALAERGVAFLRLTCERTTAEREEVMRRNAEPPREDKRRRLGPRGPEAVPPAYEDALVQELADFIAQWCAGGDSTTGREPLKDPVVSVPPGTPALTVYYTTDFMGPFGGRE